MTVRVTLYFCEIKAHQLDKTRSTLTVLVILNIKRIKLLF